MVYGRIEFSDLHNIMSKDDGDLKWKSSFDKHWVLRDSDKITLRASIAWDLEEATLTGDIIQSIGSDRVPVISFEAMLHDDGVPFFNVSGSNEVEDGIESPKSLLLSFKEQTSMMEKVD